MSELQELTTWCDGFLQRLTPSARAQLAKTLARELRTSQSARIAAQLNPDGSGYAPRRPQKKLRGRKGSLKRGAMFRKLRSQRYLTAQGDASRATVALGGRVSRIASVHQYGLVDRVRPGGPSVQYARRELLGFSPGDVDTVKTIILNHLAGP
jgi:phage virion morphogenesis protein